MNPSFRIEKDLLGEMEILIARENNTPGFSDAEVQTKIDARKEEEDR